MPAMAAATPTAPSNAPHTQKRQRRVGGTMHLSRNIPCGAGRPVGSLSKLPITSDSLKSRVAADSLRVATEEGRVMASRIWGERLFPYELGISNGGGSDSKNGSGASESQSRHGGALCAGARLFGPAIFEAQKLRVMFLGVREDQHPAETLHPRTYTLTHSDITSKLTLAVATDFNASQFEGWYSKLQRDEVLAVWRHHCRSRLGIDAAHNSDFEEDFVYDHSLEPCSVSEDGSPSCCHMSLHVHCHISGGHFWLNMIAALRYWIFRKELPVVLEAFRHGDRALFDSHPDLEDAVVWVHFHSNLPQYNLHECWGPLWNSAQVGTKLSKGHLIDAAQHLFHPAAAFTAAAAAREHRWPWGPEARFATVGNHHSHQDQGQQQNHQQQQQQLQPQQQLQQPRVQGKSRGLLQRVLSQTRADSR